MNKKIFSLLSILLILLLCSIFLYYLVNKPKEIVVPTLQSEKTMLDTRFAMAYGKVLSIQNNILKLSLVKDPTLTDYIFDNIDNIDLVIDSNSIVKGFDVDKNIYNDLLISDIKKDNFVTVFIDNSTSTEYKVISVKVFNKNIIK